LGTVALLLAFGLAWLPFVSGEQLPADRAVTISPSNVCFIPTLYQHLLGRSPSPSETGDGLTFLGSHTRTQYAALLLSGAEYKTDVIQSAYRRFLGRSATAGEVSYWLGVLGTGGTDELLYANILGSNEYFLLPRVGGTNTGFVTAIYLDVLNRPVDSSSLTFWVAALEGTTTRLEVAQALLSGAEYRTELVQGWYQRFLARGATTSEVNAWLSVFVSGATDEQIIADITGLDEYFNRAGFCKIDLPLILR
jgi:uncharacterized protein DUF4214